LTRKYAGAHSGKMTRRQHLGPGGRRRDFSLARADEPAQAPLHVLGACSRDVVRGQLETSPLPGGLTARILGQALPRALASKVVHWLVPLNRACERYEIDRSARRLAAFLGHVSLESNDLSATTESLYYRDAHHINGEFRAIKTDAEARAYVRAPQALANKVYANRIGNGDEASGDGWRFRGRGLVQLTGRANYAALSRALGVDFIAQPDLVASSKYAAASAGYFWKSKGLNELADAEMYVALSRRINRSLDKFHERESRRRTALDAICGALLLRYTSVALRGLS